MDINKKYIIIFGTLILSLVIITGAITYYKGKEEQAQIPDVKQSVLGFSQDYPTNFDEISNFISSCKDTVFPDIEGLKNNKGIKEIVCTLEPGTKKVVLKDQVVLVGDFMPSFSTLDSIVSFKSGKYLGISVDLKDVVREYNPSLLEEDKLYFCDISEPSLTDPLVLQLESKYHLFFDEGNISCSGVEMNKTPSMIFFGVVPQAESLSIKQYLVDEQTVSDVLSKKSFSERKNILNNYPVIWQMEKPITL